MEPCLTVGTAEARTAGLHAFPSAALWKIWGRKLRAKRCARAPPSYTADILRRRDDSCDMLGYAFQDLPAVTIKTSIRLVTWQLPAMAKLLKWGKKQDSICTCSAPAVSAAHVMLRCPTLSNAITAAHESILNSFR